MRKVILLVLICFGWQTSAYAQVETDSSLFLGKSRLFISPTFSVSNRIAKDNPGLLGLVNDQYVLDWSVDMNVGYFIKNNFSIGAFISYGQNEEEITLTRDGSETTRKTFGNSITFSPNIRNYFGPRRLL